MKPKLEAHQQGHSSFLKQIFILHKAVMCFHTVSSWECVCRVGQIKSELYKTAGDEMHEYELPVYVCAYACVPKGHSFHALQCSSSSQPLSC